MSKENQIKLFILLALVFAPVILMPSSWFGSGINMTFMSNLSYAEEGFSVNIPRGWFIRREIRGSIAHRFHPRVYAMRAGNRGGHRVRMYIRTAELPADAVVSVEELVRESNRMYSGRLAFVIGADARTQIRNLRGRPWYKTTFTLGDGRTRVFWHTIDRTGDRARLYGVAFFTNSFSDYEPVFARMMESFTIHPVI